MTWPNPYMPSLYPQTALVKAPHHPPLQEEEASVEREAEKRAHPTEEDTGWGRHEGQDRPFLFLPSMPTVNTPEGMHTWPMFPLTSSVALPQFPHLQLEGDEIFATESSL